MGIRLLRRRFMWLLVTLLVVPILGLGLYGQPARVCSDLSYEEATRRIREIYPIIDFKTTNSNNVIFNGDRVAAIRREYPAYDYLDPCWDLDVSHQEVVPGRKYRIEIVNKAKFEHRVTVITIEEKNKGSCVTVSSWDEGGLVPTALRRDRLYERNRVQEIERILQKRD